MTSYTFHAFKDHPSPEVVMGLLDSILLDYRRALLEHADKKDFSQLAKVDTVVSRVKIEVLEAVMVPWVIHDGAETTKCPVDGTWTKVPPVWEGTAEVRAETAAKAWRDVGREDVVYRAKDTMYRAMVKHATGPISAERVYGLATEWSNIVNDSILKVAV